MQYIGALGRYTLEAKELKENLYPLGGSRKITLQKDHRKVKTGPVILVSERNAVGFEL